MAEIQLRPRISYPREARSGARYLISVDLDHSLPPDDWPYRARGILRHLFSRRAVVHAGSRERGHHRRAPVRRIVRPGAFLAHGGGTRECRHPVDARKRRRRPDRHAHARGHSNRQAGARGCRRRQPDRRGAAAPYAECRFRLPSVCRRRRNPGRMRLGRRRCRPGVRRRDRAPESPALRFETAMSQIRRRWKEPRPTWRPSGSASLMSTGC